MNTPDLVIRLDESGRIVEILSTLPLTYVTVEDSPIPGKKYIINETKKEDFLGTHSQILRRLEMTEPSKEFDVDVMFNLCKSAPILQKALEKAGYKTAMPWNTQNAPIRKELHTLFNAFVKADKKLMEQYLNLQR